MQDIEIEIQVRISETAKLQSFLKDKAVFVGESYQKDQYFTPAHRDFVSVKPVAEWLRLRESDTNAVTYKKWHFGANGKSQYCDEYETPVENIAQMRKIFAVLNIEPIITVEKTRKVWRYKKYEIALDRVTGLGDFVEVEYKASTTADPTQITSDMVEFLKQIGCGTIERNYKGYPFMLLYPQEVEFEIV